MAKHPNVLILKSITGQKRTCNKIVHWLSNLSIMSREMFAGEPSKPSWKKEGKKIIFCSFFSGGGGGLTGKSIYSRQFVHRHLIPLKCKTRKKKITPLLSCVLSVLLCLLSWIYQYMLLRKDNKLNSIEKGKLGSGGVGYISSGWKQG